MRYIILFAFLCISFSCKSVKRTETKPNIILIMADDLGYSELGCTGHPSFKTPVLDAMASKGILFSDFHSNGAVCSPTRAALMTGRYQTRSGIEGVVTAKGHRHTGLALSELTMAESLKKANYATAMFGKWHIGYKSKFNPIHQGFDEFKGFVSGNIDLFSHIDQEGHIDWWQQDKLKAEEGYMTKLITDHGIRFIKKNKNKPFFLYLAHAAPHYPYQGPNDKGYRTPGNPKPVLGLVKDKDRAYKEMVEYMDLQIGRVLATLKEEGLSENTLVIFCSDNGGTGKYGSSNKPFRGKKGQFYEGGHRVPAIMYWPSKIAPAKVSDTVLCMDFMPTFIELSGQDKVPSLDGVSLTGIMVKKHIKPRSLFWRKGDIFALRKGDWKLIGFGKKIELYNLKEDKSESKNLFKSQNKIALQLLKEYRTWEADAIKDVEFKSK